MIFHIYSAYAEYSTHPPRYPPPVILAEPLQKYVRVEYLPTRTLPRLPVCRRSVTDGYWRNLWIEWHVLRKSWFRVTTTYACMSTNITKWSAGVKEANGKNLKEEGKRALPGSADKEMTLQTANHLQEQPQHIHQKQRSIRRLVPSQTLCQWCSPCTRDKINMNSTLMLHARCTKEMARM